MLSAEFLERERHRLDILLPGIAHQTDERAGVDPAGQECSYWHIGHEMMAHAVAQRLAGNLLRLLLAHWG